MKRPTRHRLNEVTLRGPEIPGEEELGDSVSVVADGGEERHLGGPKEDGEAVDRLAEV